VKQQGGRIPVKLELPDNNLKGVTHPWIKYLAFSGRF
jgi:hypothetical protein